MTTLKNWNGQEVKVGQHVSSRAIHSECFTCGEGTVHRFHLDAEGHVLGLVCTTCECERLPVLNDFR